MTSALGSAPGAGASTLCASLAGGGAASEESAAPIAAMSYLSHSVYSTGFGAVRQHLSCGIVLEVL